MELTNLHAALCAAQAEMGSAQEGGYNPHFRSSFATLTDLINASRPALTKNGLAVTQYPESDGESTYLITMLLHSSGESIESRVKMVLDKPSDVQSFGKTMTYLKRYVYAAMVGITISDAEDDDGNSISVRDGSSRSDSNPYQNVTTPGSDCISAKQLAMLKAKLSMKAGSEDDLIKRFGSLDKIPWKKFNEILAWIDPTMKKD
jgi:hypothetical protein